MTGNERGQTFMEYALILAVLGIGVACWAVFGWWPL